MRLIAARSIDEAVAAVTAGAVPLAGGTDLLVGWDQQPDHPAAVCDLGRLDELRGIDLAAGRVRLGALVTHAEVARHPLLRAQATLLAEAASSVGAVQVRARGTVGGNVANASPAGDVLTALWAYDTLVELCGPSGLRTLPLHDFVRGPRQTARAQDEIVTALSFPLGAGERSGYEKLGLRAAQAIAVVCLAVRLRPEEGVVQHAAFALGSVGPTPLRAVQAEEVLRGRRLDRRAVADVAAALAAQSRPIDDVRASADYRRAMGGALFERFLERAGLGPDSGEIS